MSAADAADKLETVARKKAGLLGVSELSNDMRELREAIKDGNAKARLAVDKFVWTMEKWIGSFVVELGGLDMLVFTGGIGENDIEQLATMPGIGCAGYRDRSETQQCTSGARRLRASDSSGRRAGDSARRDLMIVNHVLRLLAA